MDQHAIFVHLPMIIQSQPHPREADGSFCKCDFSLSPESHTPESRRGCACMIVMRIFHLQTPQATESPLHNHQSLVLVGRHSLLVLIEYPCHFFQIFSVPFVDIFLRRLGNMRDTNRLAGHIEQLSQQPTRVCQILARTSRNISKRLPFHLVEWEVPISPKRM